MTVRGRLAFDDQGRLVEIDPNASDPTNPSQSDINPVTVEDFVIDGKLTDNVDAGGNDITNLNLLSTDHVDITESGEARRLRSEVLLEQYTAGELRTTYTFSGLDSYNYDWFIFELSGMKVDNNRALEFRVNGDSGANYDRLSFEGTEITGDSEFRIGWFNPDALAGRVYIRGKWHADAYCEFRNLVGGRRSLGAHRGINTAVSSPLTSVKFGIYNNSFGDGTNEFPDISVWGTDVVQI